MALSTTVSAIARERRRGNHYNDERYGRFLALMEDAGNDRTPLGEYLLEEWLPQHRIEVEPTTFRGDEASVRMYIVPLLGHIPVCELSRVDILHFHQVLLQTPCGGKPSQLLSKGSVVRIHSVLSSSLQRLVHSGRIYGNPAWGCRPKHKKSEHYEPLVWSPRELTIFLEWVKGDALCALWNLLALSGIRRGEALALRWGDLSESFRDVAINRSLAWTTGGYYLSAPKGFTKRRVTLARSTSSHLRRLYRSELRRAEVQEGKLPPSEWIFSDAEGAPLVPGQVTKRFGVLVRDAGLPQIRLHDLRHTHASHLLEAGATLNAVQERLGHSDPLFTIRSYIHMAPTRQHVAIKNLESFYRDIARSEKDR